MGLGITQRSGAGQGREGYGQGRGRFRVRRRQFPRPPSVSPALPARLLHWRPSGHSRHCAALLPLLWHATAKGCASPNDVIVCLCRNGIRPAVPHQASIPPPSFGQSVASSAAIAALHSFGWQFPADSAIPAQKVPTFCVVRQTALPAGGKCLPPLSSRLPIPIG